MKLLLLIFVSAVSVHSLAVRSANSELKFDSFNIEGRAYIILHDPVNNFTQAENFCKDQSMKLMSIQGDFKQQELADYIDNNDFEDWTFWTSGVRDTDGQFIWSATGEIFDYTNWDTEYGQPDESADVQEVCVMWNTWQYKHRWFDEPCITSGLHAWCES